MINQSGQRATMPEAVDFYLNLLMEEESRGGGEDQVCMYAKLCIMKVH